MQPCDIAGDAAERGNALGQGLGGQIEGHVRAWLGALAAAGIEDPRRYVAQFLDETRFRQSLAVHARHLLLEVETMAAAAGVDADLLFALQLMDEEWAYRKRTHADLERDKCSAFACQDGQGAVWCGQNMDLGSYTDGFQAVVRMAPNSGHPEITVFTLAGVVALMGLNSASLTVCVNSLPMLPSQPTGIPVAFMIRLLLEASSLEEAADALLTLPHATNQHYLLASPEGIRSFEACSLGVRELPMAGRHWTAHTNHPLDPKWARLASSAPSSNSLNRLASLDRRLGSGPMSRPELMAALSSADDVQNPVCRLRRDDVPADDDEALIAFTTGSMIVRMAALSARPDAWFSLGPPCARGYDPLAPTM